MAILQKKNTKIVNNLSLSVIKELSFLKYFPFTFLQQKVCIKSAFFYSTVNIFTKKYKVRKNINKHFSFLDKKSTIKKYKKNNLKKPFILNNPVFTGLVHFMLLTNIKLFKRFFFHFRYYRFKTIKLLYKISFKRLSRRLKNYSINKIYMHFLYRYYKLFNLIDAYKNLDPRYINAIRKIRRFGSSVKKSVLEFKKNFSRTIIIINKFNYNRFALFVLLNYFLNTLISNGYKKRSQNILLRAFFILKYKYNKNLVVVLKKALENVRPLVFFRTLYIGGKKYKIPVPLTIDRSYKIGLRWLILSSRESVTSGQDIALSLASELLSSSSGDSNTIKKRRDHHVLAFENRSYIRFLRFLKN